uniref:DUF4806 domain-containing protein n=1 Tax=Sipha flava TaxID=143950 RepID=A0A2S2QJU7_9HEMI
MSGNRKFQVVEFDDGLQVVPISWLTKDFKKCVYPIHVNNSNDYNKMVSKMFLPKKSWPSLNVLKVIGSSNDFGKANKKLSDAVYYNLSEVNTENEDIQKSQRKSRARKSILSSSEDELEHFIKLADEYPTPPKRQKDQPMVINVPSSHSKLHKKYKENSKSLQDTGYCSSKTQAIFLSPTKSSQISHLSRNTKSFQNTQCSSSYDQGASSLNKPSMDDSIDMYLEPIVHSPIQSHGDWVSKSLNHIMRLNAHLKMQNCMILENQKEILACLSAGVQSSDMSELTTIPEQFSNQFAEYFLLSNKEKVLEVEDMLLNNEFKINFIKRIKTFGGTDVAHFIKTCLQKLISNELSTQILLLERRLKSRLIQRWP